MKLNRILEKLTSLWDKGDIQRFFRVSYDVLWNTILFFLMIGLIGIFFAGGVGAGYFASLVKDEEVPYEEHLKKEIYNYEETSKMYFADDIYLADVRADLHREEAKLEDISETLIKAVIATEDEYFHEHKGVVPKAIIRAIVQEATNADMQTGGSTLTQQLIKNQILTNEISFDRKAKEILLALRLEKYLDKNEILEVYLNIIPYGREASGRNIAGIQTAAQGVFGIDAKDVNLPQAAFLAGLPQSPYYYTPFLQSGGLKSKEGLEPGINRMKVVLKRMFDLDYITEEEYEEARSYDIVADFIEEKEITFDHYNYVIDEIQERAQEIIFTLLVEEDGYTVEEVKADEELNEQYKILANRELRTGGYHIHSTIDKEIYDAMQEVVKNYEHFGPDQTLLIEDPDTGETIEKVEPVQTGAMLIENHTGRIISFVGGREYSLENEWNYATKARRPNGSTMKPLLAFPAAMEAGHIQPGSAIADVKITDEFPDPSAPSGYWTPSNYGGAHYGIVSVRTALAYSYNVSTAKIYEKVINDNPVEKYLEKMGVTSLEPIDYQSRAISYGQAHKGITVEENVSAFTTLGNNGNYVDSYMIEKIVTNDGEVVYEHEPDPVEVFSPQTTYLTIDMMRDVIKYGTAAFLNSHIRDRSVDWAGKTGTSSDHEDAWFVGVNPNVSFGVWIGYDTPKNLVTSCRGCSLTYSQRANKLWADLINRVAEIDPDLMLPTERFKRPGGIVERTVCEISGLLPSELCKELGLVRTDLFHEKFVPTKKDNSLIREDYVLIDGKTVLAGSDTPKEFIQEGGIAFNPDFIKENGYDKLNSLEELFPRNNRSRWEKIGLPDTELSFDLTDDGKAPSSPSSLSFKDRQLTWKKSSSKDVVGYRIYYAPSPDDDFTHFENTIETSIRLNKDRGVFYVTAVDYFGMESEPSKEIIVGEFKDPEEDKDKDKDKDDKEDKNTEEKEDKNTEEKDQEEQKDKEDHKDQEEQEELENGETNDQDE